MAMSEGVAEFNVSKAPALEGEWLLVDIQGDMEAFMRAMEVPWLLRRAASAMSFGRGKWVDSLQFTEDSKTVRYQSKQTPKPYKWTAMIDGVTETVMSEGVLLLRWEGDRLVLRTTRAGKKPLFGTREVTEARQLESNRNPTGYQQAWPPPSLSL